MKCGPVKMTTGGFTLVEMMVVCALIGILAMIALPDFANIIKNERLTAQNNDLLSDIAFTRAEAMRSGKRVTICPLNNPPPAVLACGNDWSQGRMIFTDQDQNMDLDVGATSIEKVLRVRSVLSGGNTLVWDGVLVGSGHPALQFRGSGLPVGGLSTSVTGNSTFKLCDSTRANVGRQVVVSTFGPVNTSSQVSCP